MYALRSKFHPYSGTRRQSGFGLLETLMATFVGMFLIVMMVRWMMSASEDLRAKRNADSLQKFSQMAGIYLEANQDAIVRVMSAASVSAGTAEAATVCILGGTTTFNPRLTTALGLGKATCAVDAQWLITKGILPAGYPTTNAYGQSWVAIYRLVYADYDNNGSIGDEEQQGDVEILVVATGGTAASNEELATTTVLMGGSGGMVPVADGASVSSLATCPDKTACGTNGWRALLSNFGAQ